MTEQDKIEAIEKFLNKQLKGVDKETLRQFRKQRRINNE